VKATAVVSRRIGWGRIVNILSIVDSGVGQFSNRAIDFANGFTFMRTHRGIARPMFELPSRRAEIRYRM
jgi:hypothetical protein